MKKLILVALLALTTSCGTITPKGTIKTDAIKTVVTAVVERHGTYVDADATLPDAQKAQITQEAQGFLTTVEMTETIYAPVWIDKVVAITNRHDGYVAVDPNLSFQKQRVYLRSTELLRALFQEASNATLQAR